MPGADSSGREPGTTRHPEGDRVSAFLKMRSLLKGGSPWAQDSELAVHGRRHRGQEPAGSIFGDEAPSAAIAAGQRDVRGAGRGHHQRCATVLSRRAARRRSDSAGYPLSSRQLTLEPPELLRILGLCGTRVEERRDQKWNREGARQIETAPDAERVIDEIKVLQRDPDPLHRPGPSLYVAVCGRRGADAAETSRPIRSRR